MKKIVLASLLLVIFAFAPKKITQDPGKKYTVAISLTISEYNALIQSISSSDAFTAHSANALSQSIISQLQPQLASDQRSDSLNKAKKK